MVTLGPWRTLEAQGPDMPAQVDHITGSYLRKVQCEGKTQAWVEGSPLTGLTRPRKLGLSQGLLLTIAAAWNH